MSALLLSLMFSLHWINIFQLTSIDTYGITMGDACAVSMILFALYKCFEGNLDEVSRAGTIAHIFNFFFILLFCTSYTRNADLTLK